MFHNNIVAYDPAGFFRGVLADIEESVSRGQVRVYEKSGLVFVT